MTTAEGPGKAEFVSSPAAAGGKASGAMDDHRYVALDYQLAMASEIADRVVRKHWPLAEREQAQFRNGIIALLLLGVVGAFTKDIQWVGLTIAGIMLIGVIVLLFVHLQRIQRRFDRLWESISSDGELFRFVRDSGLALGHPVEMGKPDEGSSTHLDIEFPDAVKSIEEFMKAVSMGEHGGGTPGLFVPASTLKQSAGGEAHRVYEVEFRGVITSSVSIRVSRAEKGTDITIGFPLRTSAAESRDKMIVAVRERLQDRFVAAELLGDIRAASGVPRLPIPSPGTSSFVATSPVRRTV
jgi:hypothetical protein